MQGGLAVFLFLPALGMGETLAAIAMAGAVACFMLGGSGVERVRLYGLGFLLMIVSVTLVVVGRSERVSLDYVSLVVLPGLLAFLLARRTTQPRRARPRVRAT